MFKLPFSAMAVAVGRFLGAGMQDAKEAAAIGTLSDPSVLSRSYQHGPGRKTLHTVWSKVGRSKYTPHQGEQEKARRRRQMGAA